MSLDRLLETLEREARAEAERVLATARAAAEAVRMRAEAAVAQRRVASLRTREQALRAEGTVRLAAVARRGRRAVLDARHGLLERVRAAARERIATAEGDAGSLDARVQGALACHGTGTVEIRCAPRLAAAVRGRVARRSGTTVTPDAAAPDPLVVRAADGTMEVDASLAGLFERRWPELAVEVVQELEAAR
jgi:vacuolar-type H+-ATPase subunit E/Vma4